MNTPGNTPNRFAEGTFSPDPRPAPVPRMLAAQYGLELKLLLRNGEQLLLALVIVPLLLVMVTLLMLTMGGLMSRVRKLLTGIVLEARAQMPQPLDAGIDTQGRGGLA